MKLFQINRITKHVHYSKQRAYMQCAGIFSTFSILIEAPRTAAPYIGIMDNHDRRPALPDLSFGGIYE
jgi:hypothetical protein